MLDAKSNIVVLTEIHKALTAVRIKIAPERNQIVL